MPRCGTDQEKGGGGRGLKGVLSFVFFTIRQGDIPVVSGKEESKIKFFHSVVITWQLFLGCALAI